MGTLTMNVELLDHNHVQVITAAGDIVTFTLDTDQLVQIALDRLTRGFTEEECRQYNLSVCPTLNELREG